MQAQLCLINDLTVSMKLNRKYITPFIALIFIVVGVTGTLMFFHIFDGYTEVVHEFLGISFVGCAVFHIMINWPGLKTHFGKNVFIPAAIVVAVFSTGIIVMERMNVPIDTVIINKLTKAPLYDSLKVLGVNYDKAALALTEHGLSLKGANTLEDIWIKNNVSPEDVIDIILH
jgi:hypothetical protein